MKRFESRARHRAAISTLTAAPVVLVAVLALIVSVAFVGVAKYNDADAFTPDPSITYVGNDGKPEISVKMTSPTTYKASVNERDRSFDYAGTVVFKSEVAHPQGEYTVTVNTGDYAEFDSVPTPSDLSGPGTVSVKKASKSSVVYTLTDVPAGTAEYQFRKRSIIKKTTADTDVIQGSMFGSFKPTTKIAIEQVFKSINKGTTSSSTTGENPNIQFGTCDATVTYKWRAPYGGYLMDLKFADLKGDGVVYAPFKKTDVKINDRPLSQEVADLSTIVAPDTTPPYYGNADPNVRNNPGARWVDSMNWPYNVGKFTGKVWLNANDTLEVTRHFAYRSCIDGFATDFNFDRRNSVLAVLEIAKNGTAVSGADSTAIVKTLPRPATCEDLFYQGSPLFDLGPLGYIPVPFEKTPGKAPGSYVLKNVNYGMPTLDPEDPAAKRGLEVEKFASSGLALSGLPGLDGKVYFTGNVVPKDKVNSGKAAKRRLPGSLGLLYFSWADGLATGHTHYVPMDRVGPKSGPDEVDGNLEFDNQGRAWNFGPGWAGGKHWGDAAQALFYTNFAAGDRTWKPVGVLDYKHPLNGNFGKPVAYDFGSTDPFATVMNALEDLTFTADGDIIAAVQLGSLVEKKRTELIRIEKKYIDQGLNDPTGSTSLKLWGLGYFDVQNMPRSTDGTHTPIYAMSFGPDGRLYIGTGTGMVGSIDYNSLDKAPSSPTKPLEVQYEGNVHTGFVNEDGIASNSLHDLGSCATNHSKTSPGGGVSVSKQAIDPVTGQIAPLGTSEQPVSVPENKIDFGGSLQGEARYVINVANAAGSSVDVGEIADNLTVPRGFAIEKVQYKQSGTDQTNEATLEGNKFKINAGRLDGKSVKSFIVTVTLKVTDLGSVSTQQLECSKTDVVHKNGFFNQVEYDGDKSGSDNQACVPGKVPPTAELRLEKDIYDTNGQVVPGSPDKEAFHLSAGGAWDNVHTRGNTTSASQTIVSGIEGNGVVPANGQYQKVVAGKYQLAEGVATDQGQVAGKYRPYRKWVCDGAQVDPATGIVDVPQNGRVSCRIGNIPSTVKVEKFAFTPASGSGDSHVGKVVTLSGDDRSGDLVYIVEAQNLNQVASVDTEAIFDHFTLPAGLKWGTTRGRNGEVDKPATVEILKSPAGATAIDPVTLGPWAKGDAITFLKGQLTDPNGAMITPTIKNLAPNGKFRFKVTIPVKADQSKGASEFEKHADALGKCVSSSNNKNIVTDKNYGAINTTSMDRENKDYSGDWERDNVACIPVKAPKETKPYVVKLAQNNQKHRGNFVQLVPKIGGNGNVELDNGHVVYQGNLVYRLSVRSNVSKADAPNGVSTGPVKDQFTLPRGLEWATGTATITLAKNDRNMAGAVALLPTSGGVRADRWTRGKFLRATKDQLAGGFVVASDIRNLKGGTDNSVDFLVTIPVKAVGGPKSDDQSFAHYAKATDQCKDAANGEEAKDNYPDNIGVINAVIMDQGEDSKSNNGKPADDNKACIPVVLPKASIVKLANNGEQNGSTIPLSGPDLTGTLEYTISVRSNESDEAYPEGIATGKITDTFRLPAGLKWQRGQYATVVAVPGNSGARAYAEDGSPWSDLRLTQRDLKDGAVIASTVRGLKNGENKAFNFRISIPVQAVKGNRPNSFAAHSESLGKCELTNTDRDKTVKSGVQNTVTMTNEDTSSPTSTTDNTACDKVKVVKPHVVKLAAEPSGDQGPHVGQSVELSPTRDKTAFTGLLKYKIAVSWGTKADEKGDVGSITTGAVTDSFTPPAGLLWNGDEKASVSLVTLPDGTSAQLPGDRGSWNAGSQDSDQLKLTQDQLRHGAVITPRIEGLKANKPVIFEITIPVKADLGPAEGTSFRNKFDQHKFSLSRCSATANGDRVINDDGLGAINTVVLDSEDQSYSPDWEKDNKACIPVSMPGDFTVRKTARRGRDWGSTGYSVPATLPTPPDGTATATAVYRITVTNTGTVPQKNPGVTDTFNLPEGVTIDGDPASKSDVTGDDYSNRVSVKVVNPDNGRPMDNALSPQPTVRLTTSGREGDPNYVRNLNIGIAKAAWGRDIPGATQNMYDRRNTLTFEVSIPLKFNVQKTDWQNISQCTTNSRNEFEGGLINTVTIASTTGDGTKTSEACIPVRGNWQIAKYAPAEAKPGKQPLTGYSKIGLPQGYENGEFHVSYLVQVTNNTGSRANHPDFTEDPGQSFNKDNQGNVTMTMKYLGANYSAKDGNVVTDKSGTRLENVSVYNDYVIPGKEEIPSGESRYYSVVITYRSPNGSLLPPNMRKVITTTCEEKTGPTTGTLGVWNDVSMKGDSDGSDNNKACVPVEPGRPVIIRKTDSDGNPIPRNALQNMRFVIYPDVNGSPDKSKPIAVSWINGLPEGDANYQTTPGILISENIKVGEPYWLYETKAPGVEDAKYELLPQGLKFKLTKKSRNSEGGIEILNGPEADAVERRSDGSPVRDDASFIVAQDIEVPQFCIACPEITVRDPNAMTLPHSGGLGEWPYALGGMVLIGAALMLTRRKTSGVPVRA